MAIDNIDPNELSLQDAAGMQLVHVIRRIIEEINNGGDTPTPTPSDPTDIFWCEYNVTTASEIIAAVNNNKFPVIYYDDLVFVLNKVSNNTCCFSSVYFGSMRPAFNYIEVTGSRWAEATDRLQAKLTFDYAPTQGSTNPVTSGGVYTAISNIQIDPQDIADAVDDWLNDHSSSIGGLTFEAKQALLNCFAHVAWIDGNGQTYYNALYNALFNTATLESIYALFTQGSAVIYDTDSLDSLRQYLVVTAYYSDETSAVVTDYTLSGTLTVGTSTITASYGGKSSTFNVTVSQRATLVSISAVFTQGSAVIYDTDSLDTLKQYLVVTANYSDSTTATVPSTDYTLSGTLTVGTSTITASYGGKTDTFTVTVTQAGATLIHDWDFTQGLTDSVGGVTLTLNGSASQDSTGLHLTTDLDYVQLTNMNVNGYTFEIDIGSYARRGTGHGRVMCISQAGAINSGFIYRSTGVWALYTSQGSEWHETQITDSTYFNGKTVTIKLELNANEQKIMSVYEGSTLLVSGLMTKTTTNHVYMGSNNGNAYDLTVTGLRVYNNA